MVVRDWTLPLDEEDLATLVESHRRFSVCREKMRNAGRDVDKVVKVFTKHLRRITTNVLPPPAQVVWAEHIARPLKADPAKPLPERAVAGMRSWPAARIAELAQTVSEIDAVLEIAENEAHHEAIYVEISRAYS
ncbi:MAG: hypothetical protein ACK5JT_15680 [Hyphomicrobiaceae bacterium]